jgi:glycosyltransferase involved in cell wall biosynthesis
MKVLFLNLYDDPAVSGGGAEMTLRHLTQGLQSRGLEPVILATGSEPGLSQSEHHGVRIWRAGLRNIYWPQAKVRPHPLRRMAWHAVDSYNLAMQPLLRQVLEVERPDVVSTHNLPGWSAAAWATIANLEIPSVHVLHDMYLICAKATMHKTGGNCAGQCGSCRLLRLPHRGASNRLSAVIGVSRFILDRHLDEGYFGNVPIQRVINNARDAKTLGIDINAQRASGPMRFGYIGRLDPSKGVELLLEAFFRADTGDAELWIAGTGNANYMQFLQETWGGERVKFLGRVEQKNFYPQMDVVVVPSLWNDTFPGVVFESFAFGKPVVGSRLGGVPEMIVDGENGLLFDPDHIGELVAAIERLVQDPALRARLGNAAVSAARPFLDHESWVDRYVDLYEEVVALAGVRGAQVRARSHNARGSESK